MEYAATFGLTVFLRAEDPWLRNGGCVHEGEVGTRLGLPGIPEAAETVAVARDLALIEQTGVRAHFGGLTSAPRRWRWSPRPQRHGPGGERRCHRSSPAPDRTRHRLLQQPSATCARRCARHAIATRCAPRVKTGVIGAICSDHQPHEPDAKLAPFAESEPGISGLETLLPLTLQAGGRKAADPAGGDRAAYQPNRPRSSASKPARSRVGSDRRCLHLRSERALETLSADHLVSRGHNTPVPRLGVQRAGDAHAGGRGSGVRTGRTVKRQFQVSSRKSQVQRTTPLPRTLPSQGAMSR
ncbi:MAG: hypothetical protein MZV65_12760 [Chromatiales bacterium]|nr:hypothetical protein [Chromatiales bacterium]